MIMSIGFSDTPNIFPEYLAPTCWYDNPTVIALWQMRENIKVMPCGSLFQCLTISLKNKYMCHINECSYPSGGHGIYTCPLS